ncbi:MAG: threonine synthase, partial [Phycisphaerales bacterium]|nr:threonine synthase [Phycisphaerales bacterium]
MSTQKQASIASQKCIDPDCGASFPIEQTMLACAQCGSMLDIVYDWDKAFPKADRSWSVFEQRGASFTPRAAAGARSATDSMLNFSGVWRFRELLPFWMHAPGGASDIVTVGEGRTNLQQADLLGKEIGFDLDNGGGLFLQYEGFNPSGSFKDNGMAAAFTHARMVGAKRVACASTGNTSASLAMYASLTGMEAFVFIGEGKIAYGKLSQALDFGAKTLQIEGDFDACLARVRTIVETRPELGVYLMNSVNPFRLEGQKTIMLRILEGMNWEIPDWIIVPGGNLGNCSAFAKAFMELKELGMIDRIPRLAIINASGARTLDRIVNDQGVVWNGGRYDKGMVREEYERMDRDNHQANTVASAIEINRPVNLPKALRAIEVMDGVVRAYDDETIVEHKSLVGKYGFGCEPASGASVAGARYLLEEGIIKPTDRVACVLTGHQLKDPDVTVNYHTGLPTKQAQVWLGQQDAADAIGSV